MPWHVSCAVYTYIQSLLGFPAPLTRIIDGRCTLCGVLIDLILINASIAFVCVSSDSKFAPTILRDRHHTSYPSTMAFTGGLEGQINPQRKSVSTKSDESIAVAILALVPSQRSATSFWASRWASRNSTDRAILLLFRGMAIMSLTRKEKQN